MQQYNKSVNNSMISIIIPVYNAEKYIKRCLDSIISQTFQNFEVIVIDDGSADNTGKIIDEFIVKDKRIKKYCQKNKGPLCARIMGLNLSNREYFTFCDADDHYCSRHSLQIMYDAIVNNSCDIVQFNCFVKYHFIRKKKNNYNDAIVTKAVFLNKYYPKLLCSYWEESKINVTVWDKIYKRKLIENISDELSLEKIFMGDDLLLNLFIMEKCNRFMVCSKCVYCYESLSGSTKLWKKTVMNDLDIVKKYQARMIERCCVEKKNMIWRNYYAEIASWLYLHIKAGTGYLSQDELIDYIQDVLKLDCFIKAQKYFRSVNRENWEAVNLLREGDPQKYVFAVVNDKNEDFFIDRFKQKIKKII